MSSKNYWREREERQRKLNIKNEAEYQKKLDDIYADMLENIEKEINGFYVKYAKAEGITMAEAKKRIAKIDIEAYAKKAKRYVKNKDLSKKANDEMRYYNAAMKINRLELLKANIGMHLVGGYDEIEKMFGDVFTQRTEEEMRKQAGILGKTINDNAKKARVIVDASYKNATWSERIWAHQSMLKSEIDKLLQEGLIQGKHPSVLARHLEKRFGVSKSNAIRLMVTELARVQTEAQKQSYIENGFDYYQYIACQKLDACSECKRLDEEVFKVIDMMPGENAPPMHPYCHCSTAAHMDDNDYEKWLDTYSEHGLDFDTWKNSAEQEESKKKYMYNDTIDTINYFQKEFSKSEELLKRKAPVYPVIKYGELPSEIYPAIQSMKGSVPKNIWIVQAYLQVIFARCIPLLTLTEKSQVGSNDLIYQTVSYISANFRKSFLLEDMAKDLGVSKYVLSRVFSKTFHRNFNQYLNDARLGYAKQRLENTNDPITTICLDSGYESQRTFNRVFKEKYMVSPSEYRKKLLL